MCARLGLTSLAYLWHQPQAQLLRGMIEASIEAILVKVAVMGLSPRQHLGRSLADIEPVMHRLSRQASRPHRAWLAAVSHMCASTGYSDGSPITVMQVLPGAVSWLQVLCLLMEQLVRSTC